MLDFGLGLFLKDIGKIDNDYQSTSDTKVVSPGGCHKRISALFTDCGFYRLDLFCIVCLRRGPCKYYDPFFLQDLGILLALPNASVPILPSLLYCVKPERWMRLL
jgi:hypothetical protein